METYGKFTGYGYDMARLGNMMKHIEDVTGCRIDDYGTNHEMPRLVNITNKKWEFVAIGVACEPQDVHMPCLMRNLETGEWAWSKDLIWFEEKQGFCWSHGHYTDEIDAREQFGNNCQGLIWYGEEF